MKAIRLLVGAALVIGSMTVIPSAAAGGGCHVPSDASTSYGRAEGDKAEVGIAKCMFGPAVLYVDEGTKVTWTNRDPVPHSVTGSMFQWGSTDLLELGDPMTYRFEEEGVYPYLCLLHPGMSAAVIVGDPGPETVAAVMPPTKVKAQAPLPDSAAVSQSEPVSDAPSAAFATAGLLLLAGLVFVLARRRRSAGAVSA